MKRIETAAWTSTSMPIFCSRSQSPVWPATSARYGQKVMSTAARCYESVGAFRVALKEPAASRICVASGAV